MRLQRGFRVMSWVVLAGWLAALAWAVLIAVAGVSGAVGATAYQLPGGSRLGFTPTWSVQSGVDIAAPGQAAEPGQTSFRFLRHEHDAEVQPGSVSLEGTTTLTAPPGWSGLMVAVYGMSALSGLVLALLLYQLWRLLVAAAGGRAFTSEAVRRTRTIGLVLLGWQVAEPLLWLLLSPKAFDVETESRGPLGLVLGDQEPGGPTLAGVGFAVLLVLLAEVFRYGADIEDERSLTV